MTTPATSLAKVLAKRDDPMLAVRECSWLARFADIPENAATPLAMSPPHPRAVGTYGPEYVAWVKSSQAITLRWWQELAAYRQLEHDADGIPVYREIIDSGPRRIGKSVRLRSLATWRLTKASFIGETQLAMLVSKDLAIGREIHRGAWRWAESQEWTVKRLNGAQEIEAPDESRWLLRAPDAAYGYDVGYGQVDESWGVDPQAITDGLEPALLERLWPQLHLTSTAHVKATSLMRRRLLAALRNADPDVLLLLWGAHPDLDFSVEATWRTASPHWSKDRRDLMARKYAAALAGEDEPEFDDPDPIRGWAAQYLNVWPLLESSDSGVFPLWDSLSGQMGTPIALGVACDINRRWIWLGATDGKSIGLVTPREFTGPMVSVTRLDEFADAVARISAEHGISVGIQERSAAWPFRNSFDATPVTFERFIDAGASIENRIAGRDLLHSPDPELDAAVRDATWRPVGGRKVLADKTGALDAVAVAVAINLEFANYDPLASIG